MSEVEVLVAAAAVAEAAGVRAAFLVSVVLLVDVDRIRLLDVDRHLDRVGHVLVDGVRDLDRHVDGIGHFVGHLVGDLVGHRYVLLDRDGNVLLDVDGVRRGHVDRVRTVDRHLDVDRVRHRYLLLDGVRRRYGHLHLPVDRDRRDLSAVAAAPAAAAAEATAAAAASVAETAEITETLVTVTELQSALRLRLTGTVARTRRRLRAILREGRCTEQDQEENNLRNSKNFSKYNVIVTNDFIRFTDWGMLFEFISRWWKGTTLIREESLTRGPLTES